MENASLCFPHLTTGKEGPEPIHESVVNAFFSSYFSDTMGNKGAFITMNGEDMVPKYTTYENVVSTLVIFSWISMTSDDFVFSLILP